MANTFDLEIITPSAHFYQGKAEMVKVQTLLGEESFMAGHSKACKLLAAGTCTIKERDESGVTDRSVQLTDGYIDVDTRVVVYTDSAQWKED